ncbi:hypothetical protein LEP1GSC168_1419 [Leptospira santarosai str. HAI134]|nr:hypothetical protein LEP1GSC168_1419 [Leptospira santarosai str. HAI134]
MSSFHPRGRKKRNSNRTPKPFKKAKFFCTKNETSYRILN